MKSIPSRAFAFRQDFRSIALNHMRFDRDWPQLADGAVALTVDAARIAPATRLLHLVG